MFVGMLKVAIRIHNSKNFPLHFICGILRIYCTRPRRCGINEYLIFAGGWLYILPLFILIRVNGAEVDMKNRVDTYN